MGRNDGLGCMVCWFFDANMQRLLCNRKPVKFCCHEHNLQMDTVAVVEVLHASADGWRVEKLPSFVIDSLHLPNSDGLCRRVCFVITKKLSKLIAEVDCRSALWDFINNSSPRSSAEWSEFFSQMRWENQKNIRAEARRKNNKVQEMCLVLSVRMRK